MQAADYVERVFRRIAQGKPQADIGVYRPAIQATMNDALGKFAELSITEVWRSLLENDYSLAITGTHAAFGSNTDIVPDSIISIDNVSHSSVAKKFKPVTRRSDLDFVTAIPTMPFGFYFVTLSGIDFAYKNSLTGNLNVRAVKIPLITTVPAQKNAEAKLIDVGTILSISRLLETGQMTPQQAQEAKSNG